MAGENISLAALESALQIGSGELSKLAADGETPDQFEKKVAEHVKGVVSGSIDRIKQGSFDEGFQAANRKILSDKEKAIRDKYPGLEGKTIDELFDAAYKHGGSGDWSKDPKYQGELQARETKIHELTKSLDEERSKAARTITTMKLTSKVPDVLKGKFVIPTDPGRAEKRMNHLMDDLLKGGKIEVKEVEGKLIPHDVESGKPLQTSDYKPLTFEDWVTGAASLIYDPEEGSGHRSPGNNDPEPPKGPGGSGELASLTTWPEIYAYKASIDLSSKDAAEKLKAVNDHVKKLKESGKLKDEI